MTKIQDVMTAASKAYGLLLENDKVRVMEVRLKQDKKHQCMTIPTIMLFM